MDCEIYSGKMSAKAALILGAMAEAAEDHGVHVHLRHKYTGQFDHYMTWGLGHPQRRVWTNRHLANGGHLIGWDLAYWDRLNKFRLTIDADHPHKLVKDMPFTRLSGITLRDDYNPDGPIIIVGLGRKSVAVYEGANKWQNEAVARAKRAYPRHKILVRPKGLKTPIEGVLKGASLVVCRHSNVAIDACIAGIPVVCDDGIGYALYNNDITNPIHPPKEVRYKFLANVGWWQWSPNEAGQAWEFIKMNLEGMK
jgi:hypothetical protein